MEAATTTATGGPASPEERKGLGALAKLFIALGIYFGLMVLLVVLFGASGTENEEFKPQNEFKLDPWISIHLGPLDMSINKAVLYLFLAAGATCFAMTYVAKRMATKPNRVQTAVEAAYDLTANTMTRDNIHDPKLAGRWFAFIATVFFFIWFSNIIGFIPLPVNSEESVDVFGVAVPSFALYAATANLSIPLVLTLVVWFSYHFEGIRRKGFFGYLKSWVPAGISGFTAVPIFMIEALSHFVRLISLSARLFANMLAGHLLILIMGGGMAVLLGLAYIGVATLPIAVAFFIFEVGLVASLQAFIFAILSSIYLGGAVAEEH
ncbi:MAG: F0F1 ATP synthase subunit A [Solirubrobacterales bacterium]